MSRYIDADHLRKWILSWWERTEPTSEYLKGGDILNQIDREPSIDICFCRECKHNYNTAINHGKMHPRCDFTDRVLTENDFCSRGEREGE